MKEKNKHISVAGFTYQGKVGDVEEYILKSNKLRVLYQNRPETKVVTTNITYLVGARDEGRGETGLAHMLEHMLFKATERDLKAGIKAGRAMDFEKKTGSILNANTWKDRTTYYFSYPKEYFKEVIKIEADRMVNVVLTNKSLAPERNNVLSEFDMYAGDPYFSLAVQMSNAAFHSHPYGHETIGFREDIEQYTAEKLKVFYKNYYRPDNAILMIVGDIDKKTALEEVKKEFGAIKNPKTIIPRFSIREPKQEGIRRSTIMRPSLTNIVAIGFKHAGFPTKDWMITNMMLDILTNGPESILKKILVDTGKAADVSSSLDPASETALASIFVTLAPNQKHADIEALVLKKISEIKESDVKNLLVKTKANILTNELFGRTSSLSIVAELTEYVSANSLGYYSKTSDLINSVTAKDIMRSLAENFIDKNLTIGYFIGNK